jgi:LCP family protein required for cell wall assembly
VKKRAYSNANQLRLEKNQQKKLRWKRYLTRFLAVLLLTALTFVLFSYFYIRRFEGKIQAGTGVEKARKVLNKRAKDQKINLLLIGIDKREQKHDLGRADTIIVASLRPGEKKAVLLSIPRDMRVEIPGYGTTKINHAYAYGGAALVIETVKNFLGIDINHYALVDFRGFAKSVDALGGVDIYVEKEMLDVKSKIHFTPGWHHMDGKEALKYVRFRRDAQGDFGRIKRQQKFFKAVLKQAGKISSVWRLPSLIEVIAQRLETDMDVSEMLYLGRAFMSVKEDDVEMVMLPGKPGNIGGVSYVLPQEGAIREIIYWVEKKGELPPPVQTEVLKGIRVEVLNGCGEEGWAYKVGERLSELGLTFIKAADAESFDFKKTIISYQTSDYKAATEIRRWFGFGELTEVSETSQSVDLVITLGQDSLTRLKERL